MNKSFLIAVALAVLAGQAVLADPPRRQIAVTGEGRVEAVPDMATITLGVTSEAREAEQAMAETSAAVARMLTRLEAMAIAPRDIQTQRVTLNPLWSARNQAGGRRITGFVASNTVLVRVRDLTALGQVLDTVIDDGANDFSGLQFSVQEPAPLIEAARRAAVADAMARARLLADAAGLELGPVLSMTDNGAQRPVFMAREMAAMSAAPPVPVAPGEVTQAATVSMVFAIGR